MIIYSNNFNKTELLRSLSRRGKDSFDTRIMNSFEMIEDVNAKIGFKYKKNILSRKEIEERLLPSFTKEIGLNPVTYQDFTHFVSTLIDVRKQITDDDELAKFSSTFSTMFDKDTNLSLINKFYHLYLESLADDDDEILAMREVIKLCKDNKAYECLYYFIEDDLSPLEKYFLKSIAVDAKEISISSLYDIKEISSGIPKDIVPAYGIRNEIDNVIKDIYENKYSLDDCLVVLISKDQYAYELFEASKHFGIPMSFLTGVPITLTDSYKLYRSIKLLGEKYFYDVNGYLNFLSSESLDRDKLKVVDITLLAQLLGRLKVSFDKENNDVILSNLDILQDKEHEKFFELFLEKIDRNIIYRKDEVLSSLDFIIKEFSKGISYIINNYSKDNLEDGSIFETSKRFIVETIDYSNEKIPPEIKDSYLATIDGKYICNQISEHGKLHVSGLNQALSINRKHVYFVGLNASNYPGDIKENFLFSDELYCALDGVKNRSIINLSKKNDLLKKIINEFIGLGSEVTLSYNSQEITEARELNACSVLLDYAEVLFGEENKKLSEEANATGKKGECDVLSIRRKSCNYYSDKLNQIHTLSDIALENKGVIQEENKPEQLFHGGKTKLIDKNYSPSTIVKYIDCPLKFYLENILSIDNEIKYDPFYPIAGNRFGDLFHYVLQNYIDSKGSLTLDELKDLGERIYDSYTMLDRSLGDKDHTKEDFIQSIEKTYSFLTDFDLSTAEAEKDCLEQLEGVRFHGNIDLVCKDKKGNTVIIDYKTGGHIDHKDNDINTCIQGVLYSLLYEKITGIKVTKVIFFYPRFNKLITFDNPCDDAQKELLKSKLILFADSLKNLHFPAKEFLEPEEGCKYCKYKKICKVKEKPKESKNGNR